MYRGIEVMGQLIELDKEKIRRDRLIIGYLTLIGLILIFAGTILGYIDRSYLILAFIGLFFMVAGSIKLFLMVNEYIKE